MIQWMEVSLRSSREVRKEQSPEGETNPRRPKSRHTVYCKDFLCRGTGDRKAGISSAPHMM